MVKATAFDAVMREFEPHPRSQGGKLENFYNVMVVYAKVVLIWAAVAIVVTVGLWGMVDGMIYLSRSMGILQ